MTTRGIKGIVLCLGACLLAACENPAPPPIPKATGSPTRFTITYHGYIKVTSDNREREVLTFIDTTTGREFLMVQGFGTADLMVETHRTGKTTTTTTEER